jgi:hypothetical protein
MSIENSLGSLVEELERERSLDEPRDLRRRVDALDELEGYLLDGQSMGTAFQQRAKAIYARLEAANFKLYETIRRDIQRGAGAHTLLEWMPDENGAANLANSKGYDYLDELVSGILQFEEPSAQVVQLESEMVAYQPTPARHIFDFIRRTGLMERDVLIDLGSGLGHVALMAAICTSADCTGIELEPAYVDCARKSARSLNLSNVKFIQDDVRAADFSRGTMFYLFTPFRGGILRDMLNLLRQEAARREIRICTFGPCTPVVAEEQWLSVVGPLETDRIGMFQPRD